MSKKTIPQKLKNCKVKGCKRKCKCKELCERHYKQMRTKGYIYGNPKKLIYRQPNRAIFSGCICRIELYDVNGNVKAYTIIDSEDYHKVKGFKWGMDGYGYVTHSSRRAGESVKIHQLILNALGGDHKDGDVLNNRKSNLRRCTHQQNIFNCKLSKNNISGFTGVFYDKERKAWRAVIKINYKAKYLGRFTDKLKAAKAYNKAALKYFGEFARLNEL